MPYNQKLHVRRTPPGVSARPRRALPPPPPHFEPPCRAAVQRRRLAAPCPPGKSPVVGHPAAASRLAAPLTGAGFGGGKEWSEVRPDNSPACSPIGRRRAAERRHDTMQPKGCITHRRPVGVAGHIKSGEDQPASCRLLAAPDRAIDMIYDPLLPCVRIRRLYHENKKSGLGSAC